VTPGQIIALVRDIGLLVGVGLILIFVYRGGEDRVRSADLKGLQAEIQQQAKTIQTWRQESTDAQKQLSLDLAAIHAAPVVVHDWSLREPSCPQSPVLPTTATQAGHEPSAAWGTQPGRGDAAEADRRDFAVSEFKRKWETVLARCRSLDAQWPH
jgi:hypothetical protein